MSVVLKLSLAKVVMVLNKHTIGSFCVSEMYCHGASKFVYIVAKAPKRGHSIYVLQAQHTSRIDTSIHRITTRKPDLKSHPNEVNDKKGIVGDGKLTLYVQHYHR